MSNQASEGARLIALGLDAALTEKLKLAVKSQRTKLRLSFVAQSQSLPPSIGDKADAIMVNVPAQFGQALKLVQELLYTFPKAALIVISPKSDPHLLVHFFRAGAFDVLFNPVDVLELAQALRRIIFHPGDSRRPGDWNTLQAAAHFLTRPLADQWDDLSDSLMRYFSLFLDIKVHDRYRSQEEVLDNLFKNVHGSKLQRFEKFLKDPKGLLFGLGHHGHEVSWIIKLSSDHFCYWCGVENGRATKQDIFGHYFLNLLRGQKEHFEAQLERERMQQLALTDEITGLWNQRRLHKDLEEKVESNEAFSLLFIDIDFFKNVNDQFGHVHGSQLLIDMASILRRELRGSDLIYRYGGDEFIVLLPKTPLDEGKKIALRLSASVKEHEFFVQERPYRLSLSVGIADFPTDAKTSKDLVDFADKMMYMSKKSGRGKVFHVTEVL